MNLNVESLSLFDDALEERADFLSLEELRDETAESEFFKKLRKKLIEKGAKLLIGPRGCGKTHLMRYTWLDCKDDSKLPLAIYVSFTRYYRLEPLLKQKSNAISLFHSWVLFKILLSCNNISEDNSALIDSFLKKYIDCDLDDLQRIVNQLEHGALINKKDQIIASSIAIQHVESIIEALMKKLNRKRAIILLDDAALSLTPDYLVEFFDIFRSLKSSVISPKASVYPGTTEYGPRFHVPHDADPVEVWLSVQDSSYSDFMGRVAEKRLNQYTSIPTDINELLKYAAFGIPRVYLTMLRSFSELDGTNQQKVNKIIQQQNNQILAEYNSLSVKMPQFKNIISTGKKLFTSTVDNIKKANNEIFDKNEKQIIIGFEQEELSTIAHRMIRLLIEAGLLFPLPSVHHGEDRIYNRYIPHFSSLIVTRAFSGKSKGFSPGTIIEFIKRKQTKHPLRRKLATLLDDKKLEELRLDLPACQKCGTSRLSEAQKFCHECGSELVEESIFKRCLNLELSEVPTIREWQSKEISLKTNLRTINDLLTIPDPASELRKGNQIGPVTANKIYDGVMVFIDEFLS